MCSSRSPSKTHNVAMDNCNPTEELLKESTSLDPKEMTTEDYMKVFKKVRQRKSFELSESPTCTSSYVCFACL